MLLHKTLSLSEASLKIEGDAGRFSGYASVFGGVDSYGDTIVRGAFESTLRNHGKPRMFFNHEWTMPIGKWVTVKEDEKGLFVEGEFTPGLHRAAEVRAAMKHDTLDGLSIGGFINKGDYDETESGRVIRKWSHLIEVSPVVFPADNGARVEPGSVKSDALAAIDGIDSIRDIERFLRDAGGLSKGVAAALVARAKVVIGIEGEPGAGEAEAKAMADLARRVQNVHALIKA